MVLFSLFYILIAFTIINIKVDSNRLIIILLIFSILLSFFNILPDNFSCICFNNYLKLDITITLLIPFIYLIIILSLNLLKIEFIITILIILSFIGSLIIIISNNNIIFFLSLELQSLTIYILVALSNFNKFSNSIIASLKYLIIGALASSLIIFGIVLNSYQITNFDVNIFILIGIIFKLGVAPFYQWSIEVYSSITNNLLSFISILPKFGLLINIILAFNFPNNNIIYIFIGLTIIVGSLGGLLQLEYKKLLAYSSVAQIGYLLVSLTNIEIFIIYLIQYSLTIIILLYLFTHIDKNNSGFIKNLQTNSILNFSILIILLSLAGVPPIYGFFAKFEIFNILSELSNNYLLIIIIITSVISAFYYLRIIIFLYSINLANNHISNWNIIENSHIIALGTLILILLFLDKNLLEHLLRILLW